MKLFSIDSVLYKSVTKMTDIIWLNILWLVFSLPIVTIGASTTAAYYVAMKMVKDEEGYIGRTFVKEFKESFKQSTIMWLIMLVLGYLIYLNYSIIGALEEAPFILYLVTVLATFFYVIAFIGVFPLMAKYQNTIRQTIKNSMFITICHFLHTMAMLIVLVVFVAIFWFNWLTIFFGVLLGPGLIIFIASSFYLKIFDKVVEGKEAQEQATEELIAEGILQAEAMPLSSSFLNPDKKSETKE